MNGAKYREILDENLLRSAQDLRLGRRFTFQQDNVTLSTQPRPRRSDLSECPRVSQPEPGLELDRTSLEILQIAVQQRSPFKLRIYREEWEKLPKCRCAKLVATFPRRLKAVITAKGVSTKY
ncbi:unnamed protein product [Oncorhynchus mykiss]|uniref:Uncharacterized protein n=1 Tax=Oncorhynchus mykiss TaxID=8022 RepID=A0A060YEF3_ONCMY|nr:unnamed protein product [Oncorhynchus mykiss]